MPGGDERRRARQWCAAEHMKSPCARAILQLPLRHCVCPPALRPGTAARRGLILILANVAGRERLACGAWGLREGLGPDDEATSSQHKPFLLQQYCAATIGPGPCWAAVHSV